MVRKIALITITIVLMTMLASCGLFGSDEPAAAEYSYYSLKEPIKSNISGGGKTIVICQVDIEIKDEALLETLEKKLGIVRDTIGSVLREIQPNELSDSKTLVENCKTKIKDNLIKALGAEGEGINNIFFREFAWQG